MSEETKTPNVAPPIPKPVPVPARQAKMVEHKTVPIKRTLPTGWFTFTAKGLRGAVLKNVETSTLPAAWKTAISADIDSLDAANNYVAVDAHRHQQNGKVVVNLTITGSAVLA